MDRTQIGFAWGQFDRICKIVASHFDIEVEAVTGFSPHVQGCTASSQPSWDGLLVQWDSKRRKRARANGEKLCSEVHISLLRMQLTLTSPR